MPSWFRKTSDVSPKKVGEAEQPISVRCILLVSRAAAPKLEIEANWSGAPSQIPNSLLKNLIRNGFSASFCDFRSARGHFRRQLQLWEASRQRDHCNSGPTHHPTACTWRVLSRQRLYAAPVKVNSHPTFSSPRNFTFFSMPMTFIHPNDCSTRFRFCWLSS